LAGEGGMAQTMHTHVNKCKNDKKKFMFGTIWLTEPFSNANFISSNWKENISNENLTP
jgi:hypothetical protein